MLPLSHINQIKTAPDGPCFYPQKSNKNKQLIAVEMP
jgi:hypothetical protein